MPLALLLLLGAAASPAWPQAPEEPPPPILRPILHPIPRGMLLLLPVIDTDPNRGVTTGVMPVWVLEGEGGKTVREIYAPSVDYNPIFGVTGTYRYYFYPKPDASFAARAALSQVVEHEVMARGDDLSFQGSRFRVGGKGSWNVDGSNRFYGIGPDAPRSAQTDYTEDRLGYFVHVGYPLYRRLFLSAEQSLQSVRISNGPIASLPGTGELFPSEVAGHRHQDGSDRLYLTYDSRDSAITTTQGLYAELSAQTAQRGLASEYTYQDYRADLRGFFKRPGRHRQVTALRLLFEQMTGPPVPFWLEPELGGKYTLRAYGEGRFTDRGLAEASLERRVLVYRRRLAGVATELELAPFVEAGTVFAQPQAMAWRWVRPAFGTAVRVVARPQVVGSIDFGYGQEGLAAFMDINYSF